MRIIISTRLKGSAFDWYEMYCRPHGGVGEVPSIDYHDFGFRLVRSA